MNGVFQSKGESLQQEEASLEPASRLQSLRDRDTVTRFDREVSISPYPNLTTTVPPQYNPAVEV